jgi:hypothetical protein
MSNFMRELAKSGVSTSLHHLFATLTTLAFQFPLQRLPQ